MGPAGIETVVRHLQKRAPWKIVMEFLGFFLGSFFVSYSVKVAHQVLDRSPLSTSQTTRREQRKAKRQQGTRNRKDKKIFTPRLTCL